MSGKIKTGATTWSSISSLRFKTAQGWKHASKAYIKTAAGTWSEWFAAPVIDSFNRQGAGQNFLTPADSGHTWTNFSGSTGNAYWYTNGSQAQSDTNQGEYPLAGVEYLGTEASVSVTPSPGTGVTVIASNNSDWYAAVLYQDQVDGTYPCNCSCNGHYESYSNPIGCPCGANCNVCGSTSSTSTYGATATQTGTSWSYWYSAVIVSRRCTSAQVADPYNYNCFSTSDCYSGGGGSACEYGCPSGGETGHPGNYSCYQGSPIYSYSCPSGGSLSGSTCYVTTTTCYSCSSTACGTCGYSSGSYFVSGGSYPNCDGYGSTCQQCGTLVTRYFLRLIRKISGTVTTVQTDIQLSSAPAKIKLTTSGSQITYTAYSDNLMTSALGTGTYVIPDVPTTFTPKYRGIVKSPSAYAQGSTVDNFYISG